MSSMNSQLGRLAWDQNGEENSSTLLIYERRIALFDF